MGGWVGGLFTCGDPEGQGHEDAEENAVGDAVWEEVGGWVLGR